MATAGALCGAGAAPALATPLPAVPPPVGAPDSEPPDPASYNGPHTGMIVIDNSSADSWLEVDRTLNTLLAGTGTAGSDHDGGGGAIDVQNRDVSGSKGGDWIGEIGHPPWQGESGD